jgi:hypothetical protein
MRSVERCKKAGASAESTSILIELDVIGKFLGSNLTPQVTIVQGGGAPAGSLVPIHSRSFGIELMTLPVLHQTVVFILADARVIPYNAGFEFFIYNHYMFVLFGLLYFL